MRNATWYFGHVCNCKSLLENNLIATDRPDRRHRVLSSSAVTDRGKPGRGHTWLGKPSKSGAHLQAKLGAYGTIVVFKYGRKTLATVTVITTTRSRKEEWKTQTAGTGRAAGPSPSTGATGTT